MSFRARSPTRSITTSPARTSSRRGSCSAASCRSSPTTIVTCGSSACGEPAWSTSPRCGRPASSTRCTAPSSGSPTRCVASSRGRDDITVGASGARAPRRRWRPAAIRRGVSQFVVVADDRTGALETAGACADLGCEHDRGAVRRGVEPSTRSASSSTSPRVTSRRATRALGRRRRPPHALHKIDSTLRGSWAHEVVGRQQAHCRLGAGGARVPRRRANVRGRRRATSTAFPSPRAPRRPTLEVPCARADPPTTSATRARQRSTPSRPSDRGRVARARVGVRSRCATRRPTKTSTVIARAWSAHSDVVLAGTAAVDRRSRRRGAAARRRLRPRDQRATRRRSSCVEACTRWRSRRQLRPRPAGITVLRPSSTRASTTRRRVAIGARRPPLAKRSSPAASPPSSSWEATPRLRCSEIASCSSAAPSLPASRGAAPWGDDGPLLLTQARRLRHPVDASSTSSAERQP